MGHFLAKLGAFLALQACLAAGLLWGGRAVPRSEAYLAASLDKQRRLREAPSPRVIFVGGSATAFGVESPLIEERLRVSVVNMGLYLPLGLDYMLNEAEAGLLAGDIVVVSPEFSIFSQPPSRRGLAHLLRENPRALRWFGRPELKWFLDEGHAVLGAEARRILRERVTGEQEDDPGPVYARSSLNLQGDAVVEPSAPRREGVSAYDLPDPGSELFRARVDRLNRFRERGLARRVDVCFAYPPLARDSFRAQEAAIRAVADALEKSLRLPNLGTLDGALFEDDQFSDSGYHLIASGRRLRTERLLEPLRARLSP